MAAESTPAGSVCCVVRTGGGIRYLLTLKTVLPGKPGDLVVQPSRDGRRREKIAVIWRSGKQPSSGVLALPLDGVVADRTVPEYGKLDGTEDNIRSQPNVHMVGWGTPNASGRMMKIENGLIVTDVPATAKDIGAPLFNHDRELVGIVAKIEDGKALARPIDPILNELGVWVD
jgi:hypothetical protein